MVFISSESARNVPADMIHYGVTKTAQLSLARGLAKYVAGSGVTVNSVLPGPTLSDGFAEMMKDEVARTGKPLEQLAKEFVMAHRPASVIQRAGVGGRGGEYGGVRLLDPGLGDLGCGAAR
nr:dehydrogenase [Raoultella sp. NCTC 9187]